MAYIGDYLGQLMAEVTMARMQADIEAIRIAEIYASHPLLKNMPVPRFRLPEVEIDVPVVIKNMEEPKPNDNPRGTPKISDMKESFNVVLTRILKEENIKVTAEQRRKIDASISKEAELIIRPSEVAVTVNEVADKFSLITAKALKEAGVLTASNQRLISSKLSATSRLEFQTLRVAPVRLNALVNTSEVKEAGPKENITVLRLKIREEAYEWVSVDTEEGTKDQFVIE